MCGLRKQAMLPLLLLLHSLQTQMEASRSGAVSPIHHDPASECRLALAVRLAPWVCIPQALRTAK